tara:strand:+ start:1098 stop:1496 length:399 start_codon:yes stop_codon:yes gene_type:complete
MSVGNTVWGLLLLGLGMPLTALAADIDCELMIARIGVGGGLQIRVPVALVAEYDQQTLKHLVSADAGRMARLMGSLSRVIWPENEQLSQQWRFADIHLDGSQQWVSLRIRPQSNLPDMPGGCLRSVSAESDY